MVTDRSADQPRKCPTCGRQQLVPRLIREEFDYGPGEERVKVVAENVPVLVCEACQETLYGPEAARVRHQAICRALRLLTPDEIKTVRESLGKSQAEFAQMTGIGVATLSRWERGRLIQTRALDSYLRLLQALPEAVSLLESMRSVGTSEADCFRSLELDEATKARAAKFRLYGERTGGGPGEKREEAPSRSSAEGAAT
jgi:putative zinc finger/helix-turn-helix YgiT family protein